MKIKSLGLKAFGPFTDRELDLRSTLPGLHIIYGPNEAGKSSSLRALKSLLYGFPQRTPDNFLHNYDQLLVTGCLENSDGTTLSFQRRKKRVDDITDEEENPLGASALDRFLHGVDFSLFESLYGIDHETLVRGGEEILAQKGEVGRSLFSAGAGITSLGEITRQLEAEGGDLFKLRGKNQKINLALKRYRDLAGQLKTSSLSCLNWQKHQQALEEAETERIRLEEQRRQANRERQRLERLEQALPELAALKSWQEQREELGNIAPLPGNFAESHQQVLQAIREAKLELESDLDHLARLKKKQQAVSFNSRLVSQAGQIDDFHQRLGEYRKGMRDRPERKGMRDGLRREAAQLLKQIRPDLPLDDLEDLRPVITRKKTIQQLAASYEVVTRQLALAKEQQAVSELENREARRVKDGLQEVSEGDQLLPALKTALKAGDIDALINEERQQIEQERRDCRRELRRLGLWSGELDSLLELQLPLAASIEQFEGQFGELAARRKELQTEHKKAELELRMLTEKTTASATEDLPSLGLLHETREKREEGWQLIRRQWLFGEDVKRECLAYHPDAPLEDAYEGYVHQADSLADRLRREADRVAQAAALLARIETQQTLLSDLARNEDSLLEEEKALGSSWNTLWQPLQIRPLTPKEMRGWLDAIDKLRLRVANLLQKEHQLKRNMVLREDLKKGLLQKLSDLGEGQKYNGETVGPVIAVAEAFLERIAIEKTAAAAAREKLEGTGKNLMKTCAILKEAEEGLKRWQQQWRATLAGLDLRADLSPLEAIDQLDVLQSCFEKAREAEDLAKRIDGIDRDAGQLEKEVKRLLEEVAPEMLSLELDQAILQLRSKLEKNRKEQTLFSSLTEEIDRIKIKERATRKKLQDARGQLEELRATAGTEDPEKIREAINRSQNYERLCERIADSRASLAQIGAGLSQEELGRQAAAVKADELPGQLEAIREDIEQRINPEINRLSQLVGEKKTILSTMDGNDKAAEIKEKMEQELAGIRRLAERYLRVKLASKILQLEIERYREKHQDPVLKIAAGYFKTLTLDSFSSLRTDSNDKGEPVLIGLRPEGRRVQVEGMSSGTRDQLYLALRLATLEYHMQSHEPMPFIVDDILINFDDERSRASLNALAELGKKCQVILFTHHQRIVDEARELDQEETIVVHNLTPQEQLQPTAS